MQKIKLNIRDDSLEINSFRGYVFSVKFSVELSKGPAKISLYKENRLVADWLVLVSGVYHKKFFSRLSYAECDSGIAYLDLNSDEVDTINFDSCSLFCIPIIQDPKYKQVKSSNSYINNPDRILNNDIQNQAIYVVDFLKDALIRKEPFSLIRLGDGEGRLLSFPDYFDVFEIAADCLGYQFGGASITKLIEDYGDDGVYYGSSLLRDYIISAIMSADFICVPGARHFRDDLNELNLNAQFGQLACLRELDRARPDLSNIACDHYIFHDIQRLHLFKDLFNLVSEVSIISHSNPSELLKRVFGFSSVMHYEIPGHQTFMESDKNHFPSFYMSIANSINVQSRGDLFLVAAGYLGKIYCDAIKAKGGIAIDIGSIFDGWTGVGRSNVTIDADLLL